MTCANSFANSEDIGQNNRHGTSGFFNHGSVVDLSLPLESTDQPEMEYGPPKILPLETEQPEQPVAAKQQDAAQVQAPVAAVPPPGVDGDKFKLQQEFGDPTEQVTVKGVDSAPKPYRAMLAAIQMGRDDLALEYANQWHGYMKSIDRLSRIATSMKDVVSLDPAIAETKISDQAYSNIDPQALNKFLDKRKNEVIQNETNTDVNITKENHDAINAFFGEEDSDKSKSVIAQGSQDPYAKLVDSNIDAASRKMLIRSELASKVPVDHSGNVKVLFFLKPSQQTSIDVAKQLTEAISSPTLGVSLGVVPLSVEGINPVENKRFFDESGMPALLRNGLELSRSLNISQFPALLFVTSNSDKAFLKTGKADAVFIEEVARMIGGK